MIGDHRDSALRKVALRHFRMVGESPCVSLSESLPTQAKLPSQTRTATATRGDIRSEADPRQCWCRVHFEGSCGFVLLVFGQHASGCSFEHILPRNNLFDVSMMERLLENGLPNVELQAQGRMLPGLSKLLKSIYLHLKDNTMVTSKLVAPACVASEVFFWHCPHPEEEGERSHVNKRETPACTVTVNGMEAESLCVC